MIVWVSVTVELLVKLDVIVQVGEVVNVGVSEDDLLPVLEDEDEGLEVIV